MKKTLKRWTTEENEQLLIFFSEKRKDSEKKEFAIKLGRSWPAVYNKHWDISNPEKAQIHRNRATELAGKTSTIIIEKPIKVTHIQKVLPVISFSIKIGECIVETYSSKVKINDVLIEV